MLEKLNQWLLLRSHLGIIGGLVLVGFQINQNSELIQQNTRAIRAQELSSFSDAQTQLDAAVIGEDISEAYAKALYTPADMSPAEIEQVVHYVSSRVSLLHRMFRAHKAGTVAKEDWEQQLHEIPIWLGSAFGQLFWEMSKHDYLSGEFVEAVDHAIAGAGPEMREDAWLKAMEAKLRLLSSDRRTESPP